MNQQTGLHIALALTCVLLAFFALSTCLDNDFSTADVAVVLQAQTAQQVPEHLSENWWSSWYRPLAQRLLAFEYGIAGTDSGLYHLLQILLHALNAALVFALLRYPAGTPVAAASSMLFALGFGFYGTTVFSIHSIDQVLALTWVLASGVAAARAQLLRTPHQRVASMLLAALFYVAALACNELALMGMIVIGAFMWPNRRSVFSVIRKLSLLVVGGVVWFVVYWQHSGQALLETSTVGAWLWMPWRTLQLATWMLVPLDSSLFPGDTLTLSHRIFGLLEQTRPAYSLLVGACLGWWLWRGSGVLRWLIASWLAFLIPVALWVTAGRGVEARDVYLASPFFSGLLAYGLRRLWLNTRGLGRGLTAALLALSLVAELLLVRLVEEGHAASGRTPSARAAQQILRGETDTPTVPRDRETRSGSASDQKSVPMATLEAREP